MNVICQLKHMQLISIKRMQKHYLKYIKNEVKNEKKIL